MNIRVWSVLSLRSNRCRSSLEWMSRAGILQITCNANLSYSSFLPLLTCWKETNWAGLEKTASCTSCLLATPRILKISKWQTCKRGIKPNIQISNSLLKPAPSCRQSCLPIHGNSWTWEFERWFKENFWSNPSIFLWVIFSLCPWWPATANTDITESMVLQACHSWALCGHKLWSWFWLKRLQDKSYLCHGHPTISASPACSTKANPLAALTVPAAVVEAESVEDLLRGKQHQRVRVERGHHPQRGVPAHLKRNL